MEEGTFPPNPGSAMPEPQNSRETSPNFSPDHGSSGSLSGNESSIVYKTKSYHGLGDDDVPSGGNKKIIKLTIGLFVLITLILSIFTFIIPRFSQKEAEDVSLTYWGLFEDESVVRPILTQFEEENPHIKIEYKKQDLTDYTDRLLARSANGNGPDVFRFHNTWYPTLSSLLLPLPKETIEKSAFNENYYDFMRKDLIKNGTVYGIPLHTDTLSLYINTDLFKQASTESGSEIVVPKTWLEFIDSSARLTKRDDSGAISIGGAGIGTYDNVSHAPDIISLLFAQNGVDLSNPGPYQDKIADALRFYSNFSLVEDNVWDSTQDNTLQAFSQGRLAMYFGYSWDMKDIKAQNSSLQVKVVPVPQLVTDEKINVASYWAEGVSKGSKHPNEALIFMKFLVRRDIQEKLYLEEVKNRQFGEPYSYKNLAEKLKDTDAFVFVDQSNTGVSTPFVGGTLNKLQNEKVNDYMKQAVDSILSGESEEEVAKTLLDGYTQVKAELSGVKR